VSAEEIGKKIGYRATKAAFWIGGAVTVAICAWWTFTLIFDGIPLSRSDWTSIVIALLLWRVLLSLLRLRDSVAQTGRVLAAILEESHPHK
jgi:hypothetical protein